MYFSTFEPINLTQGSIMQQAGVPMLYDSASNQCQCLPCLYICPVANVLGRAPLIQCFIGDNSHSTIPHSFKDDQRLGSASANAAGPGQRQQALLGEHLDVALRPGPPPDGVSIAEAERIRSKRVSESRIRA